MSTTDDQLSAISAQLTVFLATLDNSVNWQVLFLAGSTDDPDSFDKDGGKTGALGYYPVVNVSGQTVYMPCLARMKAIALGGANADTLDEILGTANSKLALVDVATEQANIARDAAAAKADYASQQGDYAKQQALAIGDIDAAVTESRANSEAAAAIVASTKSTVDRVISTTVLAEPFETLDGGAASSLPAVAAGIALLDTAGKIIGVLPRGVIDLAPLNAALSSGLAVRPTSEVYEYIASADLAANPPTMLDASGNVLQQRVDPTLAAAVATNTAGLASKSSVDFFEFISQGADSANPPIILDAAGNVLLRRTDPTIIARVGAAEAGLAGVTAMLGQGPLSAEPFERVGGTAGMTGGSPLLIDSAGKVLLYSGDPSAITALSAAIAVLSARMDVYHDPSGAPDVPHYQTYRLRKAKMKLRMLNLLVAGTQLSMTFNGDSYIDDAQKWFKKFADIMFAKYGRAAVGYVGFATTAQLVGYRNAFPSTTTVVDGTATSPDTYSVTSSTAGLFGEWFLPAAEPRPTSARLLWNGTADGVIQYRWSPTDAWKTLNVQGGGVQSAMLDLTGMPALGAQIALRIDVVSGSVELYGIYYAGSGTGLIINKCGNNGTTAQGWAAIDQAAWVTAMALIPTDLHAFLLGTNDISFNRTDVQFTGDITTLMSRARLAHPAAAGVPGCDLLMITPPDILPHATKPVAPYVKAIRALAPTLDCAVASMHYSFGSDPSVYSSWFDAAEGGLGFHPGTTTGAYLAPDPVLQLFNA